MRDPRVPPPAVRLLAVFLAAILPVAADGLQEDPPLPGPTIYAPEATPSDPAAQRAWAGVEAARARAAEAEGKYQASQQALRDAPDSSEAKAANRAAKKERDAAQKAVQKAESEWRKRLADSRRRRGRSPGRPPAEAAPPTSTPTPVPLGNDTILPTPGVTSAPVQPPAPGGPTESPLEGSYSGEWSNRTFISGGPASAVISVDETARTFEVVLTLGGNVFGVGAPGPQTLRGS
ncbi:MAG: hypothetical protein ABR576_14645 [Thermoanaerobaculia bacterium]